MCFTVAVNVIREEMERRFGARFTDPSWFKAGYLFSAFRLPVLPVITSDDPEAIRPAKWGLIPGWIKNRSEADKIRYKTFNARAETIFEKSSFRKPAASYHCLIPVSGFYEWHEAPFGKIPYYMYKKKEKVFALAGLYNEWADPRTGLIEPTFTIITTEANLLLAKIHNTKKRMPVILSVGDERLWLDTTMPQTDMKKILRPAEYDEIGYYPVSRKITRKDADPYEASAIAKYDYGYDPFKSGQ
ncbi:MAG: SOS response-associated peptidase [Chlorobi bacterium]|nr:SOS response-associated peptidase [Chlorobiota bacterium]